MSDVATTTQVVGLTKPRRNWLHELFRLVDASLKRDIDVIGALVLLLLASPVVLALSILVVADGGPVFFSHRRVGRNGVSFGCFKFRTMFVGAEECLARYLRYHPEAVLEWERDQKLVRDPRITPLGGMLRRTSLDEIPQMWNVLIGHMSLVGPRPVTESELRDRYGRHADIITSVRPGVTGAWQVSGRSEIDYSSRVQLDTTYVLSRNLVTDIRILLQTVSVVLRRAGAR
jgi:exopolysaccharide production protein ExoY